MGRSVWTAPTVLVLVALVASGCGVSPPSARPGVDANADAGCVFRVTPDEALSAETEAAAARWSAATGCEIERGSGGVPLRVVASIVRPDGTQAPGWTSPDRSRVEINVRVMTNGQLGSTVLHELGHALGGDHTASGGVLSGARDRSDVIDAEALASVCSRLACTAFRSESP